MQLIHGSGSKKTITEITSEGFGGLFAVGDGVHRAYGGRKYMITSPNPMPKSIVEGFYDACLSVAKGNELIADAIYSADCDGSPELARALRELELEAPGHHSYDDEDGGWSLQRLRGQAAASLGYTSVHMRDELGTTYLCLPGCSLFEIADYEASGGYVTSCTDTNGNSYAY